MSCWHGGPDPPLAAAWKTSFPGSIAPIEPVPLGLVTPKPGQSLLPKLRTSLPAPQRSGGQTQASGGGCHSSPSPGDKPIPLQPWGCGWIRNVFEKPPPGHWEEAAWNETCSGGALTAASVTPRAGTKRRQMEVTRDQAPVGLSFGSLCLHVKNVSNKRVYIFIIFLYLL